MGLDPLKRFSSRADDYARYRPSYPAALMDVLARDCGLSASSVVADIGSGTGLLSKLFLDFGCSVLGVEPNADMRAAGERFLAGDPRFRGMDGRAENTGLDTASVDLVTAGQAFHWFEPVRARAEFRRILRGAGWVALIWNERLVNDDPFLIGYEELLRRHAPEYGRVDHRRIGDAALAAFYGHSEWRTVTLPNAQYFEPEGLRGRLLSSSYAPAPGTPGHEEMMAGLEHLFASTQQEGRVTFAYETRLHYGALDSIPPSRTVSTDL
jgi:SAM-dependent methyltransferase